ncbi:MAG TPA: glycosyltransferase family 39 protein, partial [Isosphaeraceae bacterium]
MAVLAVVELAWLAWALNVPLINANSAAKPGDPLIARSFFLWHFLPAVLPGLSWRDSFLGGAVADLSHLENLPQRLPIVLAAGLIVFSGVALGMLVLRALGLHRRWSCLERIGVGFGLGMTGLGLFALLMGRAGLLSSWSARVGLVVPIVVGAVFLLRERMPADTGSRTNPSHPELLSAVGFFLIVGPFLVVMALGAMLPTIDFDAIEYHLEGPKEYFLAGRIGFLPHNVYASMPFGVEMLHLLGMHVLGDWWSGALAGQLVVASFAPMAGLMVWLTARRWGSPRAGWVAAVIYLTTPWTYRLAAIPYVEGPLCYYHAALVWAAGIAWGERRGKAWLVVGLLAGGAMAIKYPALISAVVPFGLMAVAAGLRGWFGAREKPVASPDPPPYPPPQGGRVSSSSASEESSPSPLAGEGRVRGGTVSSLGKRLSPVIAFGLGVAIVMAPWLLKNVVDTCNPVYPLGYRVFGGHDWDDAREAKWVNAHGPKPIGARAFIASALEVAGRSDWQSIAIFALAPLAFLRPGSRRAAWAIGGYVLYLFLTWWLLTHRLDRFWLPLLPGLAVLAGLGADWTRGRAWTALVGA